MKQIVEVFQQLTEELPVPNKLLLSWMIVHMTHIIARVRYMTHIIARVRYMTHIIVRVRYMTCIIARVR